MTPLIILLSAFLSSLLAQPDPCDPPTYTATALTQPFGTFYPLFESCFNHYIHHPYRIFDHQPDISYDANCVHVVQTAPYFPVTCVLPTSCGKPIYTLIDETWLGVKTSVCYGPNAFTVNYTEGLVHFLESTYNSLGYDCDFTRSLDLYYLLERRVSGRSMYTVTPKHCLDSRRRPTFNMTPTVTLSGDSLTFSFNTIDYPSTLCPLFEYTYTISDSLIKLPLFLHFDNNTPPALLPSRTIPSPVCPQYCNRDGSDLGHWYAASQFVTIYYDADDLRHQTFYYCSNALPPIDLVTSSLSVTVLIHQHYRSFLDNVGQFLGNLFIFLFHFSYSIVLAYLHILEIALPGLVYFLLDALLLHYSLYLYFRSHFICVVLSLALTSLKRYLSNPYPSE